MSDTLRGLATNCVVLGMLGGLAQTLDLKVYALLSLALQWLVFAVNGLPYSSEKYYDISGSATHLSLVVTSLVAATRARSPRQVFQAIASTLWMSRLGSFLFLRISRDGKDERFDVLKKNVFRFLSVWTIQALWVFMTQLPVLLANDKDDVAPLSVVDGVAVAGWAAGFLIEGAADVQKFVFRCDPENKGKFITSGLWSLCRQPNYFGEILMWASLALSTWHAGASEGDVRAKWAWLSPVFSAFLLLKVSGVPLVEKAGFKKWGSDPLYQHYMKNTSLIFPWFPAGPLKKAD